MYLSVWIKLTLNLFCVELFPKIKSNNPYINNRAQFMCGRERKCVPYESELMFECVITSFELLQHSVDTITLLTKNTIKK